MPAVTLGAAAAGGSATTGTSAAQSAGGTFPDFLRELGEDAVWTLSSAKPGNGVDQIRDENAETFWQSDGSQPHLVTVQWHHRVEVSEVWLCCLFKADESYTPCQLSIRIGNGNQDFQEIQLVELKEPEAWVRIPLCVYTDAHKNPRKSASVVLRDKSCGGAVDSLHTHALQIAILANHQNGRDTHLRQVKVFGPIRSLLRKPLQLTQIIR